MIAPTSNRDELWRAVAQRIGDCFAVALSGNRMPHMSGDPRARLLPHQLRELEDCAASAADAAIAAYESHRPRIAAPEGCQCGYDDQCAFAARAEKAEAERDEYLECWKRADIACDEAEARADAALTALKALVDLNDNGGPFGGEIYRDRVENAWFNARAAIRTLTPPKDKP